MRDLCRHSDLARDPRGVSEVIGFVLVFSLVLGAIVLVYTSGLGGLTDARDVEQVNNAERAFDVLANNFEKMARGQAPNRATEIKLSDSTLDTGQARRVSTNTSALDTSVAADRSRSFRYSTPGGSRITYEHGAVFRTDADGAVTMKREPDFLFDKEHTVIRYMEVVGGDQSISGETTVLVRAEVSQSELLHTEEDPGEVTFTLRTAPERATAWEAYLEDEIPSNGDCSRIEETDDFVSIECEFDADSLSVASTRIRIHLT